MCSNRNLSYLLHFWYCLKDFQYLFYTLMCSHFQGVKTLEQLTEYIFCNMRFTAQFSRQKLDSRFNKGLSLRCFWYGHEEFLTFIILNNKCQSSDNDVLVNLYQVFYLWCSRQYSLTHNFLLLPLKKIQKHFESEANEINMIYIQSQSTT